MDEWPENRRAVFRPRRTESLRAEALAAVGREFEWSYAGVMDRGPYLGQSIWQVSDPEVPWFGWVPEVPWFGWVPEEDLVNVDG